MTMSEKIKEILQSPEVPDELKPENIPVLLQTKGKRKNKISMAVTGPVGVELAGLAEDLDIVVVAVEAGAFARIIELKAVARRYLKFL